MVKIVNKRPIIGVPAGPVEVPEEVAQVLLKSNMADPVIVPDVKLAAQFAEVKAALASSSGTTGGYAVPWDTTKPYTPLYRNPLFPRMQWFSPKDRKTSPSTLIVPHLNYSGAAGLNNFFGGVQISPIGDEQVLPESEPALAGAEMKATFFTNYCIVNRTVLQDGNGVEDYLEQVLLSALDWWTALAIVNGNIPTAPQGILQSPAAITFNRSGGGLIAATDIAKMLSRCHFDNPKSLAFLGSPATLAQTQMIGALESRIGPDGVTQFHLCGIDFYVHGGLPNLGAPGDLILVNCDYLGGFMAVKPTVTWSSAPKFLQNQVVVKAFMRLGYAPLINQPIAPPVGNTLSPFVYLT